MSKKKFTFTLKGIKRFELDKKYSLCNLSNISDQPKQTSTLNVTQINELTTNNNENKYFSYVDESKREHRCLITMCNNNYEKLPTSTHCRCYWCHHEFSGMPLGCPVSFENSKLIKNYYSEVIKDNNRLIDNVSQLESEKNNYNENFELEKCDYYVTEGVFCSFNCCLAYINLNKHNPIYNFSKTYLITIFETLFNQEFNVTEAPSWKLLKNYGGNLSIDEFRENFYKMEITDTNNFVFSSLQQKPLHLLFEEKIKF
jgi:hypothetical protein